MGQPPMQEEGVEPPRDIHLNGDFYTISMSDVAPENHQLADDDYWEFTVDTAERLRMVLKKLMAIPQFSKLDLTGNLGDLYEPKYYPYYNFPNHLKLGNFSRIPFITLFLLKPGLEMNALLNCPVLKLSSPTNYVPFLTSMVA